MVIVLLRRLPAASLVRVMVRLYALSVLLRITTVVVSVRAGWYFYVLPTTWGDALMAGCLLAVLARDRPTTVARVATFLLSRWAGAAGAVVLLAFALHPASYWSPITYIAIIPVLCVVGWQLLLAVTTATAPRCRSVLSSRGLQWFGLHSYALYLYNSAAVLVSTAALGDTPQAVGLGIAVAIVLAAVSRIVVERPAAAWRRRFTVPVDRSGASAPTTENLA
jgi:peptidoglycan/LPS O-acetylase OafA/YrhL